MPQQRPAAGQGANRGTPSRRATVRARQQQRRMRLLLGAIVVVVIAIVAVMIIIAQGGSKTTGTNVRGLSTPSALNPGANLVAVGAKAPDFDLATVDGKHTKLSSLRGSTVLLEYFAVWCPVCHEEAPIIDQINTDFSSKGLKVLGIMANPYGKNYETSNRNDQTPAQASDIAWYKSTYGVKFPMLIDPSFANVNAMGVGSYPTLYVIDSAGIVRYANSGGVPYQDLADAINKAATKA